MRLKVSHYPFFVSGTFLILLFISGSLSGCAIPRIIVLDDPLIPEEHLNLGVSYERSGKEDLALREYETAAKKLPEGYLYLGNLFFQRKEYVLAEEYYRKAIDTYPSFADSYNNLAWLYFLRRERLDEAERLFMKAIELNPSKKDIYENTAKKIKEARLY